MSTWPSSQRVSYIGRARSISRITSRTARATARGSPLVRTTYDVGLRGQSRDETKSCSQDGHEALWSQHVPSTSKLMVEGGGAP
jgi:hypothetical protein